MLVFSSCASVQGSHKGMYEIEVPWDHPRTPLVVCSGNSQPVCEFEQARTAWNGPTSALQGNCGKCARHADKGGERAHRGSASAHTHYEHKACTGRATRPSSRNAQTAWNGVPAGKGKIEPDRGARGMEEEGGGKQEPALVSPP